MQDEALDQQEPRRPEKHGSFTHARQFPPADCPGEKCAEIKRQPQQRYRNAAAEVSPAGRQDGATPVASRAASNAAPRERAESQPARQEGSGDEEQGGKKAGHGPEVFFALELDWKSHPNRKISSAAARRSKRP